MRRALTFLPLALLFIANVVPSKAQSPETAASTAAPVTMKPPPERVPAVDGIAEAPGAVQYYDILRNTSFTCAIGTGKQAVVWEKNNTEISLVPELKDRFKLEDDGAKLVIPRSAEEDYGNYACKVGESKLYWQLRARLYTKLPSTDTSVVEGQKLKLVCRLLGKPAVPVQWYYNKDHTSYDADEKELGVKVVETDRIKLEDSEAGLVDGTLVIEAAERGDAGGYSCAPLLDDERAMSPHEPAKTVLRVKDMYAALWPFLGICAEVLVLCAIILVYEKRRTKPELDDSDTDNHDQKKS